MILHLLQYFPNVAGKYQSAQPILLRCLLFLFLILFVAELALQPFYADEAYIGEHAYLLARDGYVHSNFFRGELHQEEHFVVYHYAFVHLGALLIKGFGFSLFLLRSVSWMSIILICVLLALYLRREQRISSPIILTTLLLFLFMPVVTKFSGIFRPEAMGALLGLGSFYCLYRHLRGFTRWFVVGSGICAGLAMLTHLNGVIIIVAGCVLLLRHKRWLALVLFTLIALLTFSPYLIQAYQYQELFVLQFSQPVFEGKTNSRGIMSFVINLLHEHKRLFWNGYVAAWTILTICSALVLGLKKRSTDLLWYVFTLVCTLGAIMNDKARIDYLYYYAPLCAIVIAEAVDELYRHKFFHRLLWRRSMVLCIGIYVVLCIITHGKTLVTPDRRVWQDVALHETIGKALPRGASCLAPMSLMYHQIEHNLLVSSAVANYKFHNNVVSKPMPVTVAAEACKRLSLEYLVVCKSGEPEEQIIEFSTDRTVFTRHFTILSETQDFIVARYKNH